LLRNDKVKLVEEISEKLGRSQSVILADFCGLNVEAMTDLRRRLRTKDIAFQVVKNRLAKWAVADSKCDNLDAMLQGNTAWAFGIADPIEPAKILIEFAKENEKLVIKGGLLEGRRIDANMVEQLAKMPGRTEMLSMLAGAMKQPAAKLARAMSESLARTARALSALIEKKESAGESAT
jgi:large subunit ribosomal protein L10